jgi:hypothetical protein
MKPITQTQISIRGKQVLVRALNVHGFEVVMTGRWLQRASIKGEDYILEEPASDAERLISELRRQRSGADLFTFAQRIPDTKRRFSFPVHWENAAVLPILGYSDWWENRLSQDTRRNVRLSSKRGLVVRAVKFDDAFVEGIRGIYNETKVRQGRRFWHYGKNFETVKRENGTFLDTSEFIGAYLGSELIGFLKMVYLNEVASIMQILSKTTHYEKRPMNALIAKAVEICNEKRKSHLIYRKYTYHKHASDSLTEFKRRNGFEQVIIPRYFVPLTLKGRMAVALKLHLGLSELVPASIVCAYIKARTKYYDLKTSRINSATLQIGTG